MQLFVNIWPLLCVYLLAVCGWTAADASEFHTTYADQRHPTFNQKCRTSADCASNQRCIISQTTDYGEYVLLCKMYNHADSSTLNATCSTWKDCDSNQMCRPTWPVDGRFVDACTCDDPMIWDPAWRSCRKRSGNSDTYNQKCNSTFECALDQHCEYTFDDEALWEQRCICSPGTGWDYEQNICRYLSCSGYCPASLGFACYSGKCEQCVGDGDGDCYDFTPPIYDYYPPQRYNPMTVYVIVSICSGIILIGLFAWKMAVLRRQRHQGAGPTAVVVNRADTQQRAPVTPATPDAPPKYSNLETPIWWSQSQPTVGTRVNIPSAPTPTLLQDSPPTYTEVAAIIAANNTRLNAA